MAPSRHRSHRRREAAEVAEEDEEEDDKDEDGEAARRRRYSKRGDRGDARRGNKRKESYGGVRSSKKTRSGENESDSEKKGRKPDYSSEESGKRRGRNTARDEDNVSQRKKLVRDRGDEAMTGRGDDQRSKSKRHGSGDKDVESDRYRYNSEEGDGHHSRERPSRNKDKERYRSDCDDRKHRDREGKHRGDEKGERSKRSHSDHGDNRKRGMDDEYEQRTSKDVDTHRKESKHRKMSKDREDDDREKDEDSHWKESKCSDSRKKSRHHEEEYGEERNKDSRHKESKRWDDIERASDRDHQEEKYDRDGEKPSRSYDEEHRANGADRNKSKVDENYKTHRKADSFRNADERSRVSSTEGSRTKDSEQRSPYDDHYPRKEKRREPSRDRSYEEDYWRRPRYYKDERDERSRHYRGYQVYRDEDRKRSPDDRTRRGPSLTHSSGRPNDYSRPSGSYRRTDGVLDGAEGPWRWQNSFFPPFAPHYGVGGYLEQFPASVYGMRSVEHAYPPSTFVRGPASFVGEDGYPHPWHSFQSAAASLECTDTLNRASPDEQAPQGCPPAKLSEASAGLTLKDGKFAEDKRQVLSRLSVSKELAGPEAYERYMKFITDEKIKAPDVEVDALSWGSDDDLVLEADPQGEDLLRTLDGDDLVNLSEPSLLSTKFEAAVKLYRRAEEENRLQKSLVGSYILPVECLSVLQSEAHPSRDFSKAAKQSESGVECSTGNDEQTHVSQEAGGALKVATRTGVDGGGGLFPGKKKTTNVDLGLDDDNSREDSGRGSDDKHRFDCNKTSSGDGDKDGVRDKDGDWTPQEDAEEQGPFQKACEVEIVKRPEISETKVVEPGTEDNRKAKEVEAKNEILENGKKLEANATVFDEENRDEDTDIESTRSAHTDRNKPDEVTTLRMDSETRPSAAHTDRSKPDEVTTLRMDSATRRSSADEDKSQAKDGTSMEEVLERRQSQRLNGCKGMSTLPRLED